MSQPLRDAFVGARKRAGLSQDAVAAAMGTTASAVSRLEAGLDGKGPSPTLATLMRYAKACGMKLDVHLHEVA